MNRNRFYSFCSLILFVIISNYSLFSQKSSDRSIPKTIFELISQHEEVTILTDINYLINNRATDDYIEGQIQLEDGRTLPVKYKVRGKFRRSVCDFPPIGLKFSKDDLKLMGLSKHNKLKLVTHCLEDNKIEANDNVMKEYMAYKLYNILNPNSFQVKAFKITYKDTSGNLGKIRRQGFLIEDTDEMTERLGGEECEDCLNSSPQVLSKKDEAMVSLFQYMIGNEDWSIPFLRNVKIAELPTGIRIPVPYDFDFSGLINAPYAKPNSDYKLYSVTDRYFIGETVDKHALNKAIEHFKTKEKEILKFIKGFKLVSYDNRLIALDYIESFYSDLDQFYDVAPGLEATDVRE